MADFFNSSPENIFLSNSDSIEIITRDETGSVNREFLPILHKQKPANSMSATSEAQMYKKQLENSQRQLLELNETIRTLQTRHKQTQDQYEKLIKESIPTEPIPYIFSNDYQCAENTVKAKNGRWFVEVWLFAKLPQDSENIIFPLGDHPISNKFRVIPNQKYKFDIIDFADRQIGVAHGKGGMLKGRPIIKIGEIVDKNGLEKSFNDFCFPYHLKNVD